MANLKGEAKIIAKQDGQNFALTVEVLQEFLRSQAYTGDLVPDQDATRSLGSPSLRWKEVYVDGNSLHIGNIVLSEDAGRLHVENEVNPLADPSYDLSTTSINSLSDVDISGITDDQVLKYNGATGEFIPGDALSSSLTYYGVIGTESGEVLAPAGDEPQGAFYLVNGTHILNSWPGIPDGTEANTNDIIVKGATEWTQLDDAIGGGGSGVTSIVSETTALVVDSSTPSVPRLSIADATDTESGLMSAGDKSDHDELVTDALTGIVSGTSALKIDPTNPKQPELNIDLVTKSRHGLMSKDDKTLLMALPEIEVSDTAPQDPKEGDFWFDSDDAVLSVYYVDDNGTGAWMGVSSDDAGIADIVSTTAALKVDKTDPTVTKLKIDKATAGLDGLMSKEDKATLDEIDLEEVRENIDDINQDANKYTTINFEGTPYLSEHGITRSSFEDNGRFIYGLRGYHHPHTNEYARKPIAVFDLRNNTVSYKGLKNPTNDSRYESILGYIMINGEKVFFPTESIKDHAPMRLKADGSMEFFGGNNGLKICKSWAYLNYITPLDDEGRFYFLSGNPLNRLATNSNPQGSRQAQVSLLLDIEDIKNQNQIEEYTNDDGTYGTLTKTLSATFGGHPVVTPHGIYVFQSDKNIRKLNITDLASKNANLVGVGPVLPFESIAQLDDPTKFVAEKGKINGLTLFNERTVIWHAQGIGITKYDIIDETVDVIYETPELIEYGVNGYHRLPTAPSYNGNFYYFPSNFEDVHGTRVDTNLLKVDRNLNVTAIPIDQDDYFKSSASFNASYSKIISTNRGATATVFDAANETFTRVTTTRKMMGEVEGNGTNVTNLITPFIIYNSATDYQPQAYSKFSNDLHISNEQFDEHEDQIYGNSTEDSRINHTFATAENNRNSLASTADGLSSLITGTLLTAGEDPEDVNNTLMEHSQPCWPSEDHPLHRLIPQDYVVFSRMFEGAKRTEDSSGNIISDNKTMDSDRYGNDSRQNCHLFHIPTGKVQDFTLNVVHWDGNPSYPKYPALRGWTCIPRDNGDVDMYAWTHNPRRNAGGGAEGGYGQPHWSDQTGPGQPLFRLHIPADPDFNNPFAGVTMQHTNIYCDLSHLEPQIPNPYQVSGNNTSDQLGYQYEIDPTSYSLVDTLTGERHYFISSYNKGSKDYVTLKTFKINFDPDDYNEGTITPVQAHPDSFNGNNVSGIPIFKKDINGVDRCFLYGSPLGLAELYFVGPFDDRKPEIRCYEDYLPEKDGVGDEIAGRVFEPDGSTNALGRRLIKSKGIYDNWYKSTTLNPQFLTTEPIDPDDYFSNVIVWYQSAYGVCSLNIQDLGTRSDETRLENNFVGSKLGLSSLHIEMRDNIYGSYTQDFSSRNLRRFMGQWLDTRSHGSLYFFDYKSDYPYWNINNSSVIDPNAEKNLFNDTRILDNDGNATDQFYFKRGIIKVTPNYVTNRIEIRGIPVGYVRKNTNQEVGNHEDFTGECVVKFGDVFVMSGATASHSSVKVPRTYIFDPKTERVHRLSNTEVHMTGLLAVPDHGIVIGSSYGADGPAEDNSKNPPVPAPNPTKRYMIGMTSNQKVVQERQIASNLRKLYAVTGDSVADDPNTWTESPPQTAPTTTTTSEGSDGDETEWDNEYIGAII